nr:MAG: hypothetical protein E4H34_04960 [Hyphomicrobiales bacterium]
MIFRGLFAVAAAAGIVIAYMQISGSSFAAQSSVWSFNMWCIEMEMLPAERCRERRPGDWTAYQAYISRTEHFEQEMLEEDRRQAEAQERLDRQSTNPGARIP